MLKALERAAKRALTALAVRLVAAPALEPSAVDLGEVRRILVVRPHNERGDMLLMVPLLRALRETLPGRSVTVLASAVNAGVLEGNPLLDRLLVADARRLRRRPWEWVRLVRVLRALKADLALLPTTVSYSVTSAVLTRMCGARWRAGSDSGPFGHQASRVALNLVVPHPPETLHESERNLAAARAIGIDTRDLSPLFVPSNAQARFAESFLAPWEGGRRAALLHLGAGKLPNRWPAERFGELARRLGDEEELVALFAVGPGEEDLFARAVNGHGRGGIPDERVLRGRSLGELAATAAHCRIYIGNDTGPLHLAAAVGALTLALLGPTNPGRWLPLGARVHHLAAAGGDLERLPVEDVLRVARALLHEDRWTAGS